MEKAKLIELDEKFQNVLDDGQKVDVQFNPESLKVTFANQIVQPKDGDQSSGTAGRQFVGAGTTKLVLTLWFDVNAVETESVDDVRRQTQKVIYFMNPKKTGNDRYAPPGVRFQWGTFMFDGMVEGLEETLEFFSPEGKPLRASINLTLSQQKILIEAFTGDGKVPARPGRRPLTAAKQGSSLQNMAAKNTAASGSSGDWRGIATANGIEDALRMAPGQLVDLSATADLGLGGGASIGVGASLSAGASPGGAGLNASLGGAASGSLSFG
jgi:contractile injection system tube protein